MCGTWMIQKKAMRLISLDDIKLFNPAVITC